MEPVLRWVVFGVWVFWLLRYWQGGLTAWSHLQESQSSLDRGLMVTIGLCTLGLTLAALAWLLRPLEVVLLLDSIFITLAGAGLVVAGVAGTFYSRSVLGTYWTADVRVRTDQRIVERGPYAWVRHPIYSAAILLYLGMALAFPTVWTWAAVGVSVVAYLFKTWDEDRFLAVCLSGYSEYQQRVRYRLIYGLW